MAISSWYLPAKFSNQLSWSYFPNYKQISHLNQSNPDPDKALTDEWNEWINMCRFISLVYAYSAWRKATIT